MHQPPSAPDPTTGVDRHLREFVRDGYTIIRGAHGPQWVARALARYPAMRERQPAHGAERPRMFDGILELEPDLCLEAITRERVVAVAERIIGPHLQVESTTIAGFPPLAGPMPPEAGDLPGWHRDLFAAFPREEAYQRPLLFNAMTYLQDLTDANGPLRVIPGSHRRPVAIDPARKQRHHPDGVALHPRAGDAVLFHHALLHTGGHNRSGDTRFFFCVAYNHCWLKTRTSYDGPVCREIIRRARDRGDRRLLRLLGADERVLTRALYHHVLGPEEEAWARWQEEERTAEPGRDWAPTLQ